MPKESDTKKSTENEESLSQPETPEGIEPPEGEVQTPEEAPEEETEGLSRRDALEVAIAASKDDSEVPSDGVEEETQEEAPEEPEAIEPPSEWEKAEKEEFAKLPRAAQEATLNLHRKRVRAQEGIKSEKEAIAKEREELASYKQFAEQSAPLIKALGLKDPPIVALNKSVTLYNEMLTDPDGTYLRIKNAMGQDVPPEVQQHLQGKEDSNPEVESLRQQVESLTMKETQRETQQQAQDLGSQWSIFEGTQNAVGKPRFPDIQNDSEAGLELSSKIGSLVGGRTELSKEFIANAQARIPGLTYPKLFELAYVYYGGRVDDSQPEPTRSQDSQAHLARSRRAAASTPGRSQVSSSNGSLKKFKTYRDAAQAALAELNAE